MGVNYVGTEHVLLGLLAEGEGVAAQILLSSGVDTVIVQREISRFIANNEADGGTARSIRRRARSLHSRPLLSIS